MSDDPLAVAQAVLAQARYVLELQGRVRQLEDVNVELGKIIDDLRERQPVVVEAKPCAKD